MSTKETITRTQLHRLKVADLRKRLTSLGLSTDGMHNKYVVMDKIEYAIYGCVISVVYKL